MKESFFDKINTLLFPKLCTYCGRSGNNFVCDECKNLFEFYKPECFVCREKSNNWEIHSGCKKQTLLDKVYYFYEYNKIIESLIISIKYDLHKSKIKELVEFILDAKEFKKINFSKINYLTYIPIHSKKMKYRGFNQAEVICHYLSDFLQIPYLKIINKSENTISQLHHNREERLQNLKNSFQIKENLQVNLENKNILVIDDICTTGATLEEFTKSIKEKYPNISIYALCLARGRKIEI